MSTADLIRKSTVALDAFEEAMLELGVEWRVQIVFPTGSDLESVSNKFRRARR